MKFRAGINGYGRIGQCVLRALYASELRNHLEIVAINEPADIETLTYLTRYDTTHGRFPLPISHQDGRLLVGDHPIQISNESTADLIPWEKMQIDLVFECSGTTSSRLAAESHYRAGAPKVLLSHPTTAEVDATVVYGFNHHEVQASHRLISNGSCTTNCLVPVLALLDKEFGIESGVTTTIHSAMNDQPVIDSYHRTNLRLTRSAMQSIIPVDTGLAKGIDRLLPHLKGRFECLHVRVPTINVSVMDLSINLRTETTAKAVNQLMQQASRDQFAGLLGYSEEPHASVDFNTDPRSGIVDGTQTRVCWGKLVKMFCWFDNEWAYANRMLDVAHHWLTL